MYHRSIAKQAASTHDDPWPYAATCSLEADWCSPIWQLGRESEGVGVRDWGDDKD